MQLWMWIRLQSLEREELVNSVTPNEEESLMIRRFQHPALVHSNFAFNEVKCFQIFCIEFAEFDTFDEF